jgi:hypothetical protein
MSLGWAIYDKKKDEMQCKMFIKLYAFLREFMPRGLSDEFAHIEGNDVAQYLLCQKNEFAVSRHKFTLRALTAFDELHEWMTGKNWKDAIKVKNNGTKAAKAPGLYSPAEMLAMMVIDYPGTKIRDRIRSLQLEWMMEPRDSSLQVHEGYWEGITHSDLVIFSLSEGRQAEVLILADYTRIFKNFVQCRQDIRPYLQPWAAYIELEEMPYASAGETDNLTKPDTEVCVAAPPTTAISLVPKDPADLAVEISSLRRHLLSPSTKSSKELEEWVIEKLAFNESKGKFLPLWCEHWAGRMDVAKTHEEQLIIRSLFLKSLGRLESLWSESSTSTITAYLLLDMEDAELKQSLYTIEEESSGLEKIFSVCKRVNSDFARCFQHCAQPTKDLVQLICRRQFEFYRETIGHKERCKFAKSVTKFDRLRTYVLLQAFGEYGGLGDAVGRKESLPGAISYTLLEDDITSKLLHLTTWQRRALLVGINEETILVDFQNAALKRKIGSPSANVPDGNSYHIVSSTIKPFPPQRTPQVGDENISCLSDSHKVLQALFGDLRQAEYKPDLSDLSFMTSRHHSHTSRPLATATAASTEPLITSSPTTVETPSPMVVDSVQEAHEKTATPNRSVLMKYVPIKRPHSGDGERLNAKMPRVSNNAIGASPEPRFFAGVDSSLLRLEDDQEAFRSLSPVPAALTRRDLTEELRTCNDDIKGDIKQLQMQLNALDQNASGALATTQESNNTLHVSLKEMQQVQSSILADIKVQSTIIDDIRAAGVLISDINHRLEAVSTSTVTALAVREIVVGEIQSALDEKTKAIRAIVHEVKNELDVRDTAFRVGIKAVQDSVAKTVNTLTVGVFEELNKIKNSLAKPALTPPPPIGLGQDGYLNIHCPAPPGTPRALSPC